MSTCKKSRTQQQRKVRGCPNDNLEKNSGKEDVDKASSAGGDK